MNSIWLKRKAEKNSAEKLLDRLILQNNKLNNLEFLLGYFAHSTEQERILKNQIAGHKGEISKIKKKIIDMV